MLTSELARELGILTTDSDENPVGYDEPSLVGNEMKTG
jgi:hypothetical protein